MASAILPPGSTPWRNSPWGTAISWPCRDRIKAFTMPERAVTSWWLGEATATAKSAPFRGRGCWTSPPEDRTPWFRAREPRSKVAARRTGDNVILAGLIIPMPKVGGPPISLISRMGSEEGFYCPRFMQERSRLTHFVRRPMTTFASGGPTPERWKYAESVTKAVWITSLSRSRRT